MEFKITVADLVWKVDGRAWRQVGWKNSKGASEV